MEKTDILFGSQVNAFSENKNPQKYNCNCVLSSFKGAKYSFRLCTRVGDFIVADFQIVLRSSNS